jgi:CheY-like chemotaxis protein
VLRPVTEEYRMIAARRRLRLRLFAGDVVVRTDPKLLGRILRNLISNALRYTARGSVLVGHRRYADGVLVGVWDTGIGIAASQQEEIFEEFRRLPPGSDCTERGAGLGLSIVQRISRMLGHRLVVRSIPGHGSLFGVVLPISHEPATCLRRPTALPGQCGGPAALRGRSVQLIDDEPHILQGLGVLLGGWGIKVAGARSAAEALQSPDAADAPDLIIADYHLGATTGLDAIATLRRRWGDVPCVVATADYSAEVAGLVASAGHHLMHKPVRPARLRSLITHVLTAVPFEA